MQNIYALQLSIPGVSTQVYLLNLGTMKWSKLSVGAGFGNITSIGSFFTGADDRVLLIGSDVASGSNQQMSQMKIATTTNTIPTNIQPKIQMGPSIYQNSGANQKTIQRMGITYTLGQNPTTAAFPVTWSLDTELGLGASTNQNLYASGAYQGAENFTWIDINGTGRLPTLNLNLPAGDGATTRAWPQIAAFSPQWQLGDVR
jgi:hypothetical protein